MKNRKNRAEIIKKLKWFHGGHFDKYGINFSSFPDINEVDTEKKKAM